MDNQPTKGKPKTRKMYFSVHGLTDEEAAEMVTDTLFAEFSSDQNVFTPKE